ncbi:MAG: Flavodoxin [Candidatus Methanohalarchaeum thermophilum]|uniref:Flavodoxin n=1 Tax=Methanohalarchaeum thermophilum TaxID=1903181 RepID=A0A1Q6DTP0_METT1|nr:MAG: Flavodoxin [Candidatus Methanohalarchaeum thermophilum]
MKVLNLYYSLSGNTKKVAERISSTVEELGHEVNTVKITVNTDASDVDLLDYDFVFNGSGVYQWLPGEPMMDLFDELRERYNEIGDIKPGSPKRKGKMAVVYCTYGGVHTGKHEATPAVKYMEQMYDHLGFYILDEWYIIGEYPNSYETASTEGRLGDIRGKPGEKDLKEIEEKTKGLFSQFKN